MEKLWIKYFFLFLLLVISTGCRKEIIKDSGLILLKKSSSIRPEWLTPKFKETKKYYIFVAVNKDYKDPYNGLREAKFILIKSIKFKLKDIILKRLSNKFKDEGHNNQIVELVIKDLDVDNIIPDNTYYEYVEEIKTGDKYYLCYIYKAILKEKVIDSINKFIKE